MTAQLCKVCEKYFAGEYWKTVCDDCYKDKKGMLGVTTPSRESHHPALRAERELKEDLYVPPDVFYVEQCLAKLKAMFNDDDDGNDDKNRDLHTKQWQCEHVWITSIGKTCMHCGIHYQQFWDGINIENEAQTARERASTGGRGEVFE